MNVTYVLKQNAQVHLPHYHENMVQWLNSYIAIHAKALHLLNIPHDSSGISWSSMILHLKRYIADILDEFKSRSSRLGCIHALRATFAFVELGGELRRINEALTVPFLPIDSPIYSTREYEPGFQLRATEVFLYKHRPVEVELENGFFDLLKAVDWDVEWNPHYQRWLVKRNTPGGYSISDIFKSTQDGMEMLNTIQHQLIGDQGPCQDKMLELAHGEIAQQL